MVVMRISSIENLPRIPLYGGYYLIYGDGFMAVAHEDGFFTLGIPAGFMLSGDVLEELVVREFIPRIAPSELASYKEIAGTLVFDKLDAEVLELNWGWVPTRDLTPGEAYLIFVQLASDYFPEDA